jgi:hypothetical protein
MSEQGGDVILGTWEVGVDHCDLSVCERVATEAMIASKPELRIMRLCDEHAELAEATSGFRMPPGGATCGIRLGDGTACGAVTSHVQLRGWYDEGEEPEFGLLPVCRRHAGED